MESPDTHLCERSQTDPRKGNITEEEAPQLETERKLTRKGKVS